MNQTLALSISIPFLLFAGGALWPAVNLASGLNGKWLDRELEARQKIISGALKQLKILRVRLDEVFREADEGSDPFLRKVQPLLVQEPVREYVRLMNLQNQMSNSLIRAQFCARIVFWFLASFVAIMLAATILGAFVGYFGLALVTLVLEVGALVFVAGGVIYTLILLAMRSVDIAHVEVGRMTRENELDNLDPTFSVEDL